MLTKRIELVLLLLLSSLWLLGCGTPAADSVMGVETGDELVVVNVWGRSSPVAAANGAFYMTIANGTSQDDELLSVSSSACGTTELHEMYSQGDGVMGMRPVPGGVISIPAGEKVELKVGGMHVMCLDKQSAFQTGDEYEMVLTFAEAGQFTVMVEIRDEAPGGMDMGG